ncbi:hypothetical protein JR316_0006443 [Psilocybe cubensis]|uniref:Uncharacterized protein n=2 Tax=Psilocybe cubensis TaxID=181762 RepID=A0ACB8H1X7_PSICU|nr:hypothetical protein JR316_0006443 [Psilocybe cubensis]KAH9481913.1 hypothetical protein JR316_0006443 [Psilocybe cubensis]
MDASSTSRPKSRAEVSIVRHPDFYFSDGSVVIIVEKTAFRVHQSLLARHSDVFKGMWEVPQPQRADTYDGCPSVILQDSVNDFVDVMKVLYDTFHFDKINPDTSLSHLITFIAGILRISTKYNMLQLRNKCIDIIQEKFPSSLKGCDEVLTRGIKYVPSEIVRIIPLARETTVPKVLPWAFYLCAHISVDEILANNVLSWRDKALCLAGKERLWELQKKETHFFLLDFKQAPTCTTGCQTRVMVPRQLKLSDIESLRINPHPLEEYTDWKSLMICIKCQAMVESQHKEGREKVWQKLPTLFHLGTWDDINKDQSC